MALASTKVDIYRGPKRNDVIHFRGYFGLYERKTLLYKHVPATYYIYSVETNTLHGLHMLYHRYTILKFTTST